MPLDSDMPEGTIIESMSTDQINILPVPLPPDGDQRPLEGPEGAYRAISAPDMRSMLMDQIKILETEHFGLVRGMSTVSHSSMIEEGETAADSYRKTLEDRIPHVESELRRLYAEVDSLEEE